MKLDLHYQSSIDLGQPHMRAHIQAHVIECLKEFPAAGEGVINLDDIVHFFTYEVHGDTIEMYIQPRDAAEVLLNEHGLSTHEAWSPLPGSERKH